MKQLMRNRGITKAIVVFFTSVLMLTVTVSCFSVNAKEIGRVKFIVSSSGSSYRANDSLRNIIFSSSSSSKTLQYAINHLTPGRTSPEVIDVNGFINLDGTVNLTSNLILDFYNGSLRVNNHVNYYSIFNAANLHNVTLQGGTFDGNSPSQSGTGYGFHLSNVTDFLIQDTNLTRTRNHSYHFVNSSNGLVENVEGSYANTSTIGNDVFWLSYHCENIIFDKVYAHDISFEPDPALRPHYMYCGGGMEIKLCAAGQSRNITITDSRFSNFGEFGIGISKASSNLNIFNLTVNNCTFTNMGKEAIDANYMVDSKIQYNTITNTTEYGIMLWAQNSSMSENLIAYNTISNTGLNKASIGSAIRIQPVTSGGINKTIVLGNKFTNMNTAIIVGQYSNNTLLKDNTFNNIATRLIDHGTNTTKTSSQVPDAALTDLVSLAQAYGSTPSSSNWNPKYDLNGDGIINLLDLIVLATHYK